MKRILRENGLSIVLLSVFLVVFLGQVATGIRVYNEEQSQHGEHSVGLSQYLSSGHFMESTFENWESEFLQMAAYIFLTIFLRQKGSAESMSLDEEEPQDRDPSKSKSKSSTPWPVRRGGLVLRIYENSLGLAFVLLFLLSMFLHASGGMSLYNEDQMAHGAPTVSLKEFISTSQFWFESLQNWQSEFLAVAAIVVLSIFLRQRGSPESKPVDSPHGETGN